VNDQVMKSFFEKFFNQALASFFAFQQHLERQLKAGSVLPGLFPSFTPWAAPLVQPTDWLPRTAGAAANNSESQGLVRTVEELKKQVAALQKRKRGTGVRRKRR
jgi:hypothetical protein